MEYNVTLSADVAGEDGLIYTRLKNAVISKCSNNSPFVWWFTNIPEKYIKSFSICCQCDDLLSIYDYAPEKRFLHWYVEDISVNQKVVYNNQGDTTYGINEDGYWTNSNAIIYRTDLISSDSSNGWNGPGAPEGTEGLSFSLYVRAIIKEDAIAVIGSEYVQSNKVIFYDNPANLPLEGSDCGIVTCPEGYELFADDTSKCYKIDKKAPTGNQTRYTTNNIQHGEALVGSKINNFKEVIYQIDKDTTMTYDGDTVKVTNFLSRSLNDKFNFPAIVRIYGYDNTIIIKPEHKGHVLRNSYTGLSGRYLMYVRLGYDQWNDLKDRGYTSYTFKVDMTLRFKKDGEVEKSFRLVTERDWAKTPSDANKYTFFYVELDGDYDIEFIDNSDKRGTQSLDATLLEFIQSPFRVNYENHTYTLRDEVVNQELPDGASLRPKDEEVIGSLSCAYGYTYNQEENCCERYIFTDSSLKKCAYEVRFMTSKYIVTCEEELQTDYVYHLKDTEGLFYDNSTGNYYCVTVLRKLVIDDKVPSINVSILQEIGDANSDISLICGAKHKFVSCDETKTVVTSLNTRSIEPEQDHVYNMSFCIHEGEFEHNAFFNEEFTEEVKQNCECYVYKGLTADDTTHTNLYIKNDYSGTDCQVCNCGKFRSCKEDRYILVKDIDSSVQKGEVYKLTGNDDIVYDRWEFIGYDECTDEAYEGISCELQPCNECDKSYPYYRFTPCKEGNTSIDVFWRGDSVLDESKVYELAGVTYTIELEYNSNCSDIESGYYVVDEFDNIYDTCEDGNKKSYYVEDCETQEVTLVESDDIESYDGKFIQYKVDDDDRCGYIYSDVYEDGTPVNIRVIDCYNTSEECLDAKNGEEDTEKTETVVHAGRAVAPRQIEKECCDQQEKEIECKCKRSCCHGKYRIVQ